MYLIAELRQRRAEIVTCYPENIKRLITEYQLENGTAFYPSGCGLWCGLVPNAPVPEYFPENSVMVVGHNFSGEKNARDLKRKGNDNPHWLEMESRAFNPSRRVRCRGRLLTGKGDPNELSAASIRFSRVTVMSRHASGQLLDSPCTRWISCVLDQGCLPLRAGSLNAFA